MNRRKSWKGPFAVRTDQTCVKCDAAGQYRMHMMGWAIWCCRDHALEGLCSKEGGRTKAEALREIEEIDAERWRSMNTHIRAWVPVREKLPPVMEKVLAFDPLFPVIQSARHDGSAWDCEGLDCLEPTHWMAMPSIPRSA